MSARAELSEHEEWLRFASGDLETARIVLAAPNGAPAAVIFHAQQAAEKALKAVLIFQSMLVPRTHDIALLWRMVSSYADTDVTEDELNWLTRSGTGSRYPDMHIDTNRADAARAVEIAEIINDDAVRLVRGQERA